MENFARLLPKIAEANSIVWTWIIFQLCVIQKLRHDAGQETLTLSFSQIILKQASPVAHYLRSKKKDKLIVEIHNQLLYHITWRNCWFINQWCGSSKKIQNIILFGSLSNFRRLGGQYIKFDSFCLYWSCCPSTGHVAWPVKGETVALTIWIE